MNTQINFGPEVAAKLRSMLIAEAEKIAEKYSQYKGYFDNHLLVVANQEIIGRHDIKICDAGEFLLAEPEVIQFQDENDEPHLSICIWDMKEMAAKYVGYSEIRFVQKRVKLSLRVDS